MLFSNRVAEGWHILFPLIETQIIFAQLSCKSFSLAQGMQDQSFLKGHSSKLTYSSLISQKYDTLWLL